MSFKDFFWSKEGRVGRVSYLIATVFYTLFLVLSVVALALVGAILTVLMGENSGKPLLVIFTISILLLLIPLIKSSICIGKKRYQDMGEVDPASKLSKKQKVFRGLGMCLLLILIVIILKNYTSSEREFINKLNLIIAPIGIIFGLKPLIKLHFYAGDPNPNQYGDPPPMLPLFFGGDNKQHYTASSSQILSSRPATANTPKRTTFGQRGKIL